MVRSVRKGLQGDTRGYRPKPRTGYLFRRKGGRSLKVDACEDAVIYLAWKVKGRKHTVCLHTCDVRVAEQRQANIMGRIRWEDDEAYLEALVALGDEARRKLDARVGKRLDVPVGAAWQAYLDSKRRPSTSDVTLQQYRLEWGIFAAWCKGRCSVLGDVSPALAEAFVAKRDGEVSARTVNAQLVTLRRLWKVVVPDAVNPWEGLRSTQAASVTPYRPLSLAECRLVFRRAAALSPELALLVATGYYSAQRLKDAVLLKGEYVDLKAGVITMPPPAKTRRRKAAPVRIPVVPDFAALLRKVPRSGAVMPGLAARYEVDGSSISKLLRPLFAGLSADRGHASFHSLRSTFVTNMDLVGCPQRLTDQITNHAPASVRAGYSQPDGELALAYMVKALRPLDMRRAAVLARAAA